MEFPNIQNLVLVLSKVISLLERLFLIICKNLRYYHHPETRRLMDFEIEIPKSKLLYGHFSIVHHVVQFKN